MCFKPLNLWQAIYTVIKNKCSKEKQQQNSDEMAVYRNSTWKIMDLISKSI